MRAFSEVWKDGGWSGVWWEHQNGVGYSGCLIAKRNKANVRRYKLSVC